MCWISLPAAISRTVTPRCSPTEDASVTDAAPVTVLTEGHGRYEDVLLTGPDPRRADLSRTVGWFTSLFPLQLDLPAGDAEGVLARILGDGGGRLGPALGFGERRCPCGAHGRWR